MSGASPCRGPGHVPESRFSPQAYGRFHKEAAGKEPAPLCPLSGSCPHTPSPAAQPESQLALLVQGLLPAGTWHSRSPTQPLREKAELSQPPNWAQLA